MVERRKKKRPDSHRLEATSQLRTRERLTVQLSPGLLDHLRNAVYWTPGSTLAGVVEACIARAIADMEHERGHPFPPRREPLRVGRPPK